LRFAHCDPAGIAYYPRYFELCDAVIEDWTEQVVGIGRRKLHLELGYALPTVDLQADFTAVSRLGDWLDFSLTALDLGRSSVWLGIDVTSNGERRFGVRYKQVLIDMAKTQSIPWPEEWRARIAETLQ
jgi:4-hydroxybenzoyl-CoA thioesterase